MRKLRLGTRGSELAVAQSSQVAAQITAATGVPVELVIIRTRGDEVTDRPLREVGGKGLFTAELEAALLEGGIDLAVHSLKDLPTENPAGLVVGAMPRRADPRDVLVGGTLDTLPRGAVVGTGSERRRLQLLSLRPDLEIRGIRGNVGTRIDKVRRGDYAATLLAMAGLERLGRAEEADEVLGCARMIPAPGQGVLGIQCRAADPEVLPLLATIHHDPTAIRATAERAFLDALSGGCSVPAACHAKLRDGVLHLQACYAPEGGELRRIELDGPVADADALGRRAAAALTA